MTRAKTPKFPLTVRQATEAERAAWEQVPRRPKATPRQQREWLSGSVYRERTSD